jgi:hypothetical protein
VKVSLTWWADKWKAEFVKWLKSIIISDLKKKDKAIFKK